MTKLLIICIYLLNLVVYVIFETTNEVTFLKSENLKPLVKINLTGSHFKTHGFRNIEADM